MKKILTALVLATAMLLPLSAQHRHSPQPPPPPHRRPKPEQTFLLGSIARRIPHHANTSIGVVDAEKFEERSPVFVALLDFMDAEDIFKDLKIFPRDVRAFACGKEDQRHGDAEYAFVVLKKPVAKRVLDKLESQRGSIKQGERVIFDNGEKFVDMIAPDQLFFTEMDHRLQAAPRTLELRRNIIDGTFPAEKDGLAAHYVCYFKGGSMVLTVKSVIGRIPCYELKASFFSRDMGRLQRRLERNFKDELLDKGMGNVAKRLLINNDPRRKCITVTAQIAAWHPKEIKVLLDALEMDDDD